MHAHLYDTLLLFHFSIAIDHIMASIVLVQGTVQGRMREFLVWGEAGGGGGGIQTTERQISVIVHHIHFEN